MMKVASLTSISCSERYSSNMGTRCAKCPKPKWPTKYHFSALLDRLSRAARPEIAERRNIPRLLICIAPVCKLNRLPICW